MLSTVMARLMLAMAALRGRIPVAPNLPALPTKFTATLGDIDKLKANAATMKASADAMRAEAAKAQETLDAALKRLKG